MKRQTPQTQLRTRAFELLDEAGIRITLRNLHCAAALLGFFAPEAVAAMMREARP